MKFLLAVVNVCIAPFVGAYKAVRDEMVRPPLTHPTVASQVKESVRLYFAPLVGAIRETRLQLKLLIKRDS